MNLRACSLLLVLVAACTSELAAVAPPPSDAGTDAPMAPDAYVIPVPDAGMDAPVTPEGGFDGGAVQAACNGSLRQSECAALMLPAAYGFDPGCTGNPWLTVDGGVAFRPNGLASCVEWVSKTTDVNCCPE